MGIKAKFHGPAFGGLEMAEPLSNEEIDDRVGGIIRAAHPR